MKKQTPQRKSKSKKRPAKRSKRTQLRVRIPKNKYARLALLAFGIALAAFIYADSVYTARADRLVTIHDRGAEHVVLTRSATVEDALADAHIVLAPQDVTEPERRSALTTSDTVVNIYRARLIIVADGAMREKIMTPAQTPDKILADADLPVLGDKDTTKLDESGNIVSDGTTSVLTIARAPAPVAPVITQQAFAPTPQALSRAKSAQMYTDSHGVTHRETYYDLPMNIVIGACGGGGYTIRSDGAKIDKNGYVLVAANLNMHPKCSVVETSMGPGKVYDTGGFAARYPEGFDLATDWTNYDGR